MSHEVIDRRIERREIDDVHAKVVKKSGSQNACILKYRAWTKCHARKECLHQV